MPAFNDDNLVTYWSRVRTLVDTCLSNMRIHPINAFGGVVTMRTNGWRPSEPSGSTPVDPTPSAPTYDWVYGTIGNYLESVWYSYHDGGYDLPYLATIPTLMFSADSNVTFVNAPMATTVEDGAFMSCSYLTSVSLPNCITIGSSGFYECHRLSAVDLPLCTEISKNAFAYCNRIASISLPACVTIGNNAFDNACHNSPNDIEPFGICLPTCTTIGIAAFASTNINAISLPICTSIGAHAFESCHHLSSVNIPACESIEERMFGECYELSSVTLVACREVGGNAFRGCRKLLTLDMSQVSQFVTVKQGAFTSTPIDGYTAYTSGQYGSVYVPVSLYSSFLRSAWWPASRIVSV